MRLAWRGTSVSVPGFHPVITYRFFRIAQKARKNPDFQRMLLEAFERRGAKVTKTARNLAAERKDP
jgi:hypothetical protein